MKHELREHEMKMARPVSKAHHASHDMRRAPATGMFTKVSLGKISKIKA
jgi:hypothetical protein